MSIKEIKTFAEKAKADPALAEKLKACEKDPRHPRPGQGVRLQHHRRCAVSAE
ncbi:Nif11-like leader peptide family natural product precursor [Azotobacter vinelandii]